MSLHPLQATAFPADAEAHFFVLASGNRLSVISTESDEGMAIAATAQDHQGLIRLVGCHGTRYIVSTGEDKMLNVYEYQANINYSEEDQHDETRKEKEGDSTIEAVPKAKLELRSSRELVKRANAMQITEKGDIIVGDKFGDVYVYPLIAPTVDPTPTTTTTDKTKPKVPKAQPILGHVSMLNALVHVPAAPDYGLPHDLIVTGDRDEHVRVSRYPQGHIIDKFLWGSQKFVTALLYIPATLSFPTPLIVSGGGDSTLQVWDLASGKLLNRFGIQDALEKYIVVGPELPTPVPAGRRKDKSQGGGRKGKGKQVEQDGVEGEQEEDVLVVNEEEQVEVAEETEETQTGGINLPTGLGVIHLELVGGHSHRAGAGVIVAAAGCTALLYVPLELLLGQSTQRTTQIVDYSHPVLALCGRPNENENENEDPSSSSAKTDFHVTIDVTRPKKTESTALEAQEVEEEEETERSALQQATYEVLPDQPEGSFSGEMELIWDQALVRIAREAGTPTTNKDRLPDVSSLYPVLSLLHHPDTNFEVLARGGNKSTEGEEENGESETNGKGVQVWKSMARGRGQKRGLDESGDAEDGFGKGKRAAGRAEIQRRLELEQERLKKLQTGGDGENKAMEE